MKREPRQETENERTLRPGTRKEMEEGEEQQLHKRASPGMLEDCGTERQKK